MSERFDLPNTEIGKGTMLIEASAGTGKTFTISVLVLRLLLERPELTIDRILVTTFTELATAELRGRIREKLRLTIAAFRSGRSDDKVLEDLRAKHASDSGAVQRLEEALNNFDEAPIFTIHGFCQRVLAERAFESGTLFDAELVTNQSELLHEIVFDFWRKHFYEGERFAALLALKNKITPTKLFGLLEELMSNPTLRVLPEATRPLSEIAADLHELLEQLRGAWKEEEEGVRQLFADPKWIGRNRVHADPVRMSGWLDDFATCLSEKGGTVEQLVCLSKLSKRAVHSATLARHPKPERRIFDLCESLLEIDAEFSVAVLVDFFAYARTELAARKQRQNILSFNDLLTRLDDALAAPGGAELARSIREKYQAALIDEFQDTDPVQYQIFSRIYAGSDAPVAYIGDPKQAIYSFRGADVFTYMRAAAAADRKFTLATNWRSEGRLVEAVNTIFDHPKPFLLDEIVFEKVTANAQADDQPLRVREKKEPPFQFWTAEEVADLPARVASEIVRLLGSEVTIGGAPLVPGQFAVLTSTNHQATEMQIALRVRRVPSVLYSSANIFKTHEADELRDILAAVVQPTYEKVVRAALCTDALGQTGNDLDRFMSDEKAWETQTLRFQKDHEIWRERGFIQMLRHLSAVHGVRQRLLGFPDGERRLTNFLHLAELLHTACMEQQLGMNGLVKWLAKQMAGGFAEREEHELRLESDEKAVRIITVHKSKGLEYDVVFCPFVAHTMRAPKVYHDASADGRLTLNVADPKAEEPQREKEARAERLRQFYVALTRARHRCTMIWERKEKDDKSAPAYLLDEGATLSPRIETSADIQVAQVPEATEEKWKPAHEEAPLALAARRFAVEIDRRWGSTSFTRLISGREADPLDEGRLAEPIGEVVVETQGIHAFRRGTTAGTCLHEILEKVNFADLSGTREIVARRLHAYGIEGFDQIVLENVEQLAALPLSGGKERFSLREVPGESRIAELEFSFPIRGLTIAKLADAFQLAPMPLPIERLQFQLSNGFLKGFIDLTFAHDGRFYIADWKSNWLGPTTAAYCSANVAAEMQRNFYTLQLCLYSVALHRYLRLRLPDYDFDRHFGGAFYIFLRGIDPGLPENGVHFERPSREFVEKLSAIFE